PLHAPSDVVRATMDADDGGRVLCPIGRQLRAQARRSALHVRELLRDLPVAHGEDVHPAHVSCTIVPMKGPVEHRATARGPRTADPTKRSPSCGGTEFSKTQSVVISAMGLSLTVLLPAARP